MLAYKVIFHENTLYNDTSVDKLDVNKLFGYSEMNHKKNSARFGWNCLNGKINIYAYCYVDGVRVIKFIGVIKTNKTYNMILKETKTKYVFSVISEDSVFNRIDVIKTKNHWFGYNLWPYFGGNKTAPHDMNIELKKI
jgi:hypothetical protein